MSANRRLLLLADEVAGIDADLGSAQADAWLVAAVDALAHALVDVADGAPSLTVSTPVRALPAGHDRDAPADRASCAAAATQLRRARAIMVSAVISDPAIYPDLDGAPQATIAEDVGHALDMLASALQDVASEPGVDRHQAVRAQAHRSVRSAYRLVQPHGQSTGLTQSEDSR